MGSNEVHLDVFVRAHPIVMQRLCRTNYVAQEKIRAFVVNVVYLVCMGRTGSHLVCNYKILVFRNYLRIHKFSIHCFRLGCAPAFFRRIRLKNNHSFELCSYIVV